MSKAEENNQKDRKRIYAAWNSMKMRCKGYQERYYRNYTLRGIKVCSEWESDFNAFYIWAINNGYAPNLSLDRIDNNKGYSPQNCRWATPKEQMNNVRYNRILTLNGVSHTLSEWGDITGIDWTTIQSRKRRGWSDEEALTIPRFGKRTIQKEPMTTQDIMNVCKQSISCSLCKNKKEFCEMSGISKYVFFSIQKGEYKISDGIYLKVKAMQDKILKIKERKEK